MGALMERMVDNGMFQDDAKLEALYNLSRIMLSEEATRCAMHIFQLQELGNTKEDREEVRRCVAWALWGGPCIYLCSASLPKPHAGKTSLLLHATSQSPEACHVM
jgi:hypothetical protein